MAKEYSYKGNLEQNVYTEDIYEIKNKNGENETIYGVKVNEDFKIGRFNIGTYLHGRCHLFALVANEITNAPVHIMGLPDYHNPQRGDDLSTGVLLTHVYLSDSSPYLWDAQGTSEIEQTIEKYCEIEEIYYDKDEATLDILTNSEENIQRIKSMMKKGYIANFAKEEKDSLVAYITDALKLEFNKPQNEDSPICQEIDKIIELKSSNKTSPQFQ